CIVDNLIPHEKRLFDMPLIRYWVRCVDGFIAMSHSVEKDIADTLLPKPSHVLFSPHPLYDNFGDPVPREVALTRLNLDPASRYALFFGFIRDYKGLDLLLEAFADERLRNRSLKLVVAGEFYCDPAPYREIIARHHLGDRVIMSNDFIPDSRVVDYFCAADVVVQPYKTATQSGVTQIAYHFGKPMIVTDVGGLAEIVPDGKVGYVVLPDPGPIADAIERFFGQNKGEEFSRNASLEKTKYTWQTMCDAIENLLVRGKN
ncbi:MAG TPA: glycosyltransferase, partial [Bacteroidales bacterium]|nr:glycosyltransferase [Bacteroidales bacterium]